MHFKFIVGARQVLAAGTGAWNFGINIKGTATLTGAPIGRMAWII